MATQLSRRELLTSLFQDAPKAQPAEPTIQAPVIGASNPAEFSRRDINAMIGKAMILAGAGFSARAEAAGDSEHSEHGEGDHHDVEHVAHNPTSLVVLDAAGTASFVDAILAIAREDDSYTQKLLAVIGVPTYNTGELTHGPLEHHKAKFPLENLWNAIALNAVRATCYDSHAAHETIHEALTTAKGVGLLMGLTSLAKGMVSAEVEANRMAQATPEDIDERPTEVIKDSIFQLCFLAPATQLPLTAFGNASVGNQEFSEVKASFASLYGKLPPSKLRLFSMLNGGRITNPQVAKRVKAICDNPNIKDTDEDMEAALHEAAMEHTRDLANLLMATACDDGQAATGDAGPLIGLFQKFGADAVKAIPAIIPYTMMIAVDRAKFAADRAGIPATSILTKERLKYGAEFIAQTWKNLAMYFGKIAPNTMQRVGGNGSGVDVATGVGMDFKLIEQLFQDIESILSAVFTPAISTARPGKVNLVKIEEALKEMGDMQGAINRMIGAQRREQGSVSNEDVEAAENKVLGPRPEHEELYALEHKLMELSEDPKAEQVQAFAKTLEGIKDVMGVELQHEVAAYVKEHGQKPSMAVIATLLKDNPKIKDLLDFNYWHDQIGAELTDTMYVITLQGLHLVFIINTVNRVIYNAQWFNKMPMMAQEWFTMALNEFMSMFADNWADAVAHSGWLTNMYFNKLDRMIDGPVGERAGKHLNDDVTQLIPTRFKARQEQLGAVIAYMQDKDPDEAVQLYKLWENICTTLQGDYWKALIMAMIAAVTGGGKSLIGNAPHFTFRAGHEDLSLIETLNDFKKHPVYQLWEFIFGAGYAIYIGPLFASGVFEDEFIKKGQKMMQDRFTADFPEFTETLRRLKTEEDVRKMQMSD